MSGEDPFGADSLSLLFENDDLTGRLRSVFQSTTQVSDDGAEEDPNVKPLKFAAAVGDFIVTRRDEIHTVCNDHYQQFIHSVDDILSVRGEVEDLKVSIVALNSGLQRSGQHLIHNAEKLIELEQIRHNISVASELVESCQEVLCLFITAEQQIAEKKFYPALRTLDKIQQHYLRKVQRFSFCRHLEQKIPMMISDIKGKVVKQFHAWLVDVRDKSTTLGSMAMKVYGDKKSKATTGTFSPALPSMSPAIPGKHNIEGEGLMRRRGRQASFFTREQQSPVNREDTESTLFEKVGIDLGPLLQCLFIHETLGARDEFCSYYKGNRLQQLNLDLKIPTGQHFEQICDEYLDRIAGFFLVEESVLKSVNGMLADAEVDANWEMAVSRLKGVLGDHVASVEDPVSLLRLKDKLALFCQTLQHHGYHTLPLLDFVEQSRTHFLQALSRRCQRLLSKCLQAETFECACIASAEEYEDLVLKNYLWRPSTTQVTSADLVQDDFGRMDSCVLGSRPTQDSHPKFPATMPFTWTLFKIADACRQYIDDFFKYGSSDVRSADLARREIATCLAKSVDALYSDVLESHQAALAQVIQTGLNASYTADLCVALDHYIVDVAGHAVPSQTSQHRLVHARQLLLQTQSKAESRMFEVVSNKVSEFMRLWDDMDLSPPQASAAPSEAARDMQSYLHTVIDQMVFLPESIREAIQFSMFKRMSAAWLELLVSPRIKKINLNGFRNLDMDLNVFEILAQKTGGVKLRDAFVAIRQTVNVFLMGSDMQLILRKEVRENQFQYVSLPRLIAILEKFQEGGITKLFKKKSNVTILIERLKELLQTEIDNAGR
eukprot:Rmarinus@m.10128